MAISLADFRWLTGPAAAKWLDELAGQKESLVRQTTRLRKELPVSHSHLILEQIHLRARAKRKFAVPGRMFFTPLGLEQATDEWVATYKAARFRQGAPVIDLCCGIGGDLLALARRGPTVAIDKNPVLALVAQANLLADNSPTVSGSFVVVQDAADVPVQNVFGWHIDPDRRPNGRRSGPDHRSGGRRSTRLELFEPGISTLEELLSRNSTAAIKLAPATQIPAHWVPAAEQEWISRAGECRQLVAWFGRLAQQPGRRRATIVAVDALAGSRHQPAIKARTVTQSPVTKGSDACPQTAAIGRYVFEPDPAVLAARLVSTLAAEHRVSLIDPEVQYLTGDSAISDLAMSCFEVIEALPFDARRVKSVLRSLGAGKLEVKKRGVHHDPLEVCRQLHVTGAATVTLLLMPVRGAVTAIVARRIAER